MKSQEEGASTTLRRKPEFPAREKKSSAPLPARGRTGSSEAPATRETFAGSGPELGRGAHPAESVGQEDGPGQASLAGPRPDPAEKGDFSLTGTESNGEQTNKRVSWPGQAVKPGPCAESLLRPPTPRETARPEGRPAPQARETPGACGSALAPRAPSAASENAPCWAKEGGGCRPPRSVWGRSCAPREGEKRREPRVGSCSAAEPSRHRRTERSRRTRLLGPRSLRTSRVEGPGGSGGGLGWESRRG